MTDSRDTMRTKLPAAAAIAAAVSLLAATLLSLGSRGEPKRTVAIDSEPSGASIFIDDVFVGVTDDRGPVLAAVSEDKHALMLSRSGHVTLFSSFDPGDSKRLHVFALRPTPRGSLKIDTTPAGADVILDGQLVGATPLEVPCVPVGRHSVRLEKVNHRPYSGTVNVAEREVAELHRRLEDRVREYLENLVVALPDEFAPHAELAHYYVLIREYDLAPPYYARSMALSERAIIEAHRQDLTKEEFDAVITRGKLVHRQIKKDMDLKQLGEGGREFIVQMQSVLARNVKRFPRLLQTRRKQAAQLEKARQTERALDTTAEALVAFPGNAELLEDQARLRLVSGDGERAPAAVREALLASEDEALGSMGLADALLAHIDDFSSNVALEMCLDLEARLCAIDTEHSRRRAHRVATLCYGLNRSADRPPEAIFHLNRALESADGNVARDALAEDAHPWLTDIVGRGEDTETVQAAHAMLNQIESYCEHTHDD